MFKKENFKEDYLKFCEDFDIDENKGSQIILGANGIGKSTIYKTVVNLHPEYAHIDYEELKKDFIKNKNKLIIGTHIADLEEKKNDMNCLIETLHIDDNFKQFNISSQQSAKKISLKLKDIYIDKEKWLKEFDSKKVNLINILENKNSNFLVNNFNKLVNLGNIDGEIKKLKDQYMKLVYDKLDMIVSDDEYICPICGSINDIPIKKVINKKRKELLTVTNELLIQYQSINNSLAPQEINENFKKIIECLTSNELNENDIINYIYCGGKTENAILIESSRKEINELEENIKILEEEKIKYYETLKNHQLEIKEIFEKKFDVDEQNINFNDEKNDIEITLPRTIDKYSTGEINLMVFTFSIYEFVASDKKCILVDDPLSSYDISNQYRIMFDLIEAVRDGKIVIILTHNIDCINIANTQCRKLFFYEYIEKINDILYIKKVNIDENDSILNINNLLKFVSSEKNKDKYLELLIDREDDLYSEQNKIFHFDKPTKYKYKDTQLSNEYFVSLIDDINEKSIKNNTFENNAIDKIIYMTALRVWIEKQFYLNRPNDDNLLGKTFGKKIEYMFPRKGIQKWTGLGKVDRKFLMSKKTMINQHNHYKSQILPFNYALNITLDELINEINDIKAKFFA